MKRISFAIFATALTATLAAAAPEGETQQTSRRDPQRMFNRLDTSGDGKVSLEEFLALKSRRKQPENATGNQEEKRTAWFKKLDTNADGFVTADEFQAFAGKHGRKHQQSAEQK
jgi:Ca2+-binding EF-hand superfamily protein